MLIGAIDNTADSAKPAKTDEEIVREAFKRHRVCREWQAIEDERSRDDRKFANADPRNAWAWPAKTYEMREGADMPCLTINNTRVHNDLIINQMSKSNYGIKIRPTGGGASFKSAEMMETLKKRTEYISDAKAQYRQVAEHQIDGGIGYLLIETRFMERSFNQEIYLKAAQDPTGVYLDPWIREVDGSDAKFGFIFERMSRDNFDLKYPEYSKMVSQTPFDQEMSTWVNDKEIILATYYRKKERKDTLVAFKNVDGDEVEKLASEIRKESGSEIYDALIDDIKEGRIDGRMREVADDAVEWFLIAGDKIVKRDDWAGKYIPICRCVGRETVIDGVLDRKGHTRPLIDANRMLNYHASIAVQYVASTVKSQWMGPARAFEGQEQWKDANIQNYAYLQYNDIDEEAPAQLQIVPPPVRIDPPRSSPAHVEGMQIAERQMMMISGQFQAQMGENDTQSAASGKAIGERQQQGDTATYHFPEHFACMLRFAGIQLLDLYPKIYDTERALHVQGEGEEKDWVLRIDPNQEDAVHEIQEAKEDAEAIRAVFNPSIGQYECVSDPGPDYATQRQEAWDAFSAVVQHNNELMGVIGDLIFRYGDFPGADKLAERLKKEIKASKPYLFDDNVDPQLAAAQEQNKRLVGLNAELMQKLANKELALKGKDEQKDVNAFKAETDRLKAMIEAMAKLALTPAQRAQMEHELNVQTREHVFGMISAANASELAQQSGGNEEPTSQPAAQ